MSFDISRAFDGVPTAQLLALAQRLLGRPAYTIVKYSEAGSHSPAAQAALPIEAPTLVLIAFVFASAHTNITSFPPLPTTLTRCSCIHRTQEHW